MFFSDFRGHIIRALCKILYKQTFASHVATSETLCRDFPNSNYRHDYHAIWVWIRAFATFKVWAPTRGNIKRLLFALERWIEWFIERLRSAWKTRSLNWIWEITSRCIHHFIWTKHQWERTQHVCQKKTVNATGCF